MRQRLIPQCRDVSIGFARGWKLVVVPDCVKNWGPQSLERDIISRFFSLFSLRSGMGTVLYGIDDVKIEAFVWTFWFEIRVLATFFIHGTETPLGDCVACVGEKRDVAYSLVWLWCRRVVCVVHWERRENRQTCVCGAINWVKMMVYNLIIHRTLRSMRKTIFCFRLIIAQQSAVTLNMWLMIFVSAASVRTTREWAEKGCEIRIVPRPPSSHMTLQQSSVWLEGRPRSVFRYLFFYLFFLLSSLTFHQE